MSPRPEAQPKIVLSTTWISAKCSSQKTRSLLRTHQERKQSMIRGEIFEKFWRTQITITTSGTKTSKMKFKRNKCHNRRNARVMAPRHPTRRHSGHSILLSSTTSASWASVKPTQRCFPSTALTNQKTTRKFIKSSKNKSKSRQNWKWCRGWASSRRFARQKATRANKKRRVNLSQHSSAPQTQKNRKRLSWISSRCRPACRLNSNRNRWTQSNSNRFKSVFQMKISTKITT